MKKIIVYTKHLGKTILSINLVGKIIILLLIGLTIYQQIHFNNVIEENENNFRYYLNELESNFSDVESAMSDLRSEVDDFDYEDWRVNVEDVRYSSDNLESQISDFSSSITDYYSYNRFRRSRVRYR